MLFKMLDEEYTILLYRYVYQAVVEYAAVQRKVFLCNINK